MAFIKYFKLDRENHAYNTSSSHAAKAWNLDTNEIEAMWEIIFMYVMYLFGYYFRQWPLTNLIQKTIYLYFKNNTQNTKSFLY